jgi:hypothetical protein
MLDHLGNRNVDRHEILIVSETEMFDRLGKILKGGCWKGWQQTAFLSGYIGVSFCKL